MDFVEDNAAEERKGLVDYFVLQFQTQFVYVYMLYIKNYNARDN